jgi:Transposase DDE domain
MRTKDRITPPRVCQRQVRDLAAQRLAAVFVDTNSPHHSLLLSVLFWAALRIASIAAACRHLAQDACDQTVRTALANALPKHRRTLERRCHHALIQDLPRSLRRGRRELAIDWHSVPYHGEAFRSTNEFRRSKPDQGTTTFHVYATAAIVHHGERFTVALTAVTARDSNVSVLRRLIAQIRQTGLKIQVVLLDRQFSNGPVIALLQDENLPFVMPAMFRGRTPKRPGKPTGFRAFKTARPGWYTHVQNVAGTARRYSVCVTWKVVTYRRKKVRRRKVHVFIAWRCRVNRTVLRELYRRRFGIETSYRQLKRARIRTSTRNPLLRLFYVAVALILRNLWVWLHLVLLARKPNCAESVDLETLRFLDFLELLAQTMTPEQLNEANT